MLLWNLLFVQINLNYFANKLIFVSQKNKLKN